jgi:hypothetical protein
MPRPSAWFSLPASSSHSSIRVASRAGPVPAVALRVADLERSEHPVGRIAMDEDPSELRPGMCGCGARVESQCLEGR